MNFWISGAGIFAEFLVWNGSKSGTNGATVVGRPCTTTGVAGLCPREPLESVTSPQVATSVALNFDSSAPITRVSVQRLPWPPCPSMSEDRSG